jgi:hypothetical protein
VGFKRDAEKHFQAFIIAPTACREAVRKMRGFFGFDATHTRSKYPMMLYIVAGLDANDQIIPLAWALVPTEDGYWWDWFCNEVAQAFEEFGGQDVIHISDRDKGLKAATKERWPKSVAAHCCQHIADNVQAYYGGMKIRKLFWNCARAKTQDKFEVCCITLCSYYSSTEQ